ncbi:hypothetical protein [Amycolatopsis sp. GM8]|uniref:terpene synthase family protein n=1 Tax=Amycolatopsis sp. GM8 TaxID=2896530 RepID=UPI001F42DE51|nr:hypothetical protein [Amycolatopsis sp. GM8]
MNTHQLPDLDSRRQEIPLPFWSRKHLRGDEFQRNTRQWAHRFGLIRDQGTLEKFDALGYGRLMSYASPDAQTDDLQLLVDWNTLFFVFDDIQDDALLAGKHAEYEWLRQQVREVVDQRERRPHRHPVLAAVSDLCSRTFPGRGEEWAKRFALNLEIWLTGHARENAFRLAAVAPAPAEYVRLRRDASTVLPNCDLIELTEGVEIPDALYFRSAYQEIVATTADIMCWTNDVHSLSAELAAGDPINLAVVLAEEQRLELADSVRKVAEMISERVAERAAAERRLDADMAKLDLPDGVKRGVRRCVRNQGSWAVGMELWDRTDTIRHVEPKYADDHGRPGYAEKLI